MLAQLISNGLMLGSVYALVAAAFTVTIGVLHFPNFSIAGIFTIAGMATWTLVRAGLPLPAAALAALACGVLLSFLVERALCTRRTSDNRYLLLLGSMAFLAVFENLALIGWGSGAQRFEAAFPDARIHAAGFLIDLSQAAGSAVALLAVCTLGLLVGHTTAGRAVRTIAEDAEAAVLLGVPVRLMVAFILLIAGALAGLAGVLFAIDYRQVSPFMGEQAALKGISAMVVGGLGNIWGAIAGGLIIGLIETVSISRFGARAADISVYGLLLVILFVRPAGLFGARGLRAPGQGT